MLKNICLLEKRMVERMQRGTFKIDPSQANTEIPSIVLDIETHNKITRELQERMPYGGDYYILDSTIVKQHYREVYRKYGMEKIIDMYFDKLFH